MNAFISYSLEANEMYIVTLLSSKMRELNTSFITTYKSQTNWKELSPYNIMRSDLFIGIISNNGKDTDKVLYEWQTAIDKKIPNIILVEDTIQLDNNWLSLQNLVRFNRLNPNPAIGGIKKSVEKYQASLKTDSQNQLNNTLTWVLGGTLLIATIGFLASNKN